MWNIGSGNYKANFTSCSLKYRSTGHKLVNKLTLSVLIKYKRVTFSFIQSLRSWLCNFHAQYSKF